MNTPNPFQNSLEKVLQERMKHARRMTREEFLNPSKKQEVSQKTSGRNR